MTFTDFTSVKKDIRHRMERAVGVLQDEFAGLRTGRAVTSLLEPVTVEAYGSEMPMNQVGTVSAPEPRMLSVHVWDKALVQAVEKAILESGLGLNPSAEGQMIRVPIPALTEERRQDLTKVAGKYSEDARVAIRNIRRHAMDDVKKAEKEGNISKDQQHEYSEEVQNITDEFVKKIDDTLNSKETEIMQV
ncbi:MAG: ribosome recycling factor [Rhodospirillaceae bacterium TMED8]|nr:ribosome recycling factor [Magnetovibrio sp.]OUT51669.1 MAG: ribosome recycling factor [Rhodospirillaceae bacterium TMED8]|tara:strand:- start:71 stop:640 length:570 start_codon:yes stop_codon:yes gene_type:complete